ncbi:katanin p80 WD40 repeat-containing subunit B1 homolog isoform X2 [Asparagus officinalis]|uniref:katanin p80 WD40 repeat-containing subunit B1 homolog isoform X2 n=1 Tax=Asparagus officinalis TaxID=4686 RepID=UPI00098E32C1|nr:katanin p80 WD40 repeat-containing subunit B1 homolog isoform X2 [Asparagus officinalis]
MATRGYKLQEFVAHGSDVTCLSIGKKSCRVFITGGEDCKVNLWAVGNPMSILSLPGQTGSVRSLTFDSAEVLVLAASSNGTIKLWDLEEAKLIRSITGHKSNCSAVEFHPFGEFFASGSSDTDLKIWDIRKKGCIHTYKGHTRGIRTIRFTPDGRWVVTGGDDHVVKLWDLTAGKLLHDFKFHNGTIRCMDFHPQEFLLATGSADRTVNFWDLETFELIGSAGPEATGVRSMVFHPDGKTLFCGLDEALKVFSWEPIRSHDFVDMGWSTLGDLSIYEGKLLGCSYHQSRIGVWVADISLIGPYADGIIPKNNGLIDPVNIYEKDHPIKLESCTNSSMILVPGPPDHGGKTKETIKCSLNLSNVYSQGVLEKEPVKIYEKDHPIKLESCTNSSMIVVPGPPDCGGKTNDTMKGSLNLSNVCSQGVSEKEAICSTKATHLPSTGFGRNNVSMSCHNTPQKFNSKISSKVPTLNSTAFSISKTTEVPPVTPNKMESSLASREKRLVSSASRVNSRRSLKKGTVVELDVVSNTKATGTSVSLPVFVPRDHQDSESVDCSRKVTNATEVKVHSTTSGKVHLMRQPSFCGDRSDGQHFMTRSRPSSSSSTGSGSVDSSSVLRFVVNGGTLSPDNSNSTGIGNVAKKFERITSPEQPVQLHKKKDAEPPCSSCETSSVKYVRGVPVQLGRTRSLVETWEKGERRDSSHTAAVNSCSEQIKTLENAPPESTGETPMTTKEIKAYGDFSCEDVLQGHDVFINNVKSRLTKLQVVRHFWECNGIKSAIDAVVKLPDYSVGSG